MKTGLLQRRRFLVLLLLVVVLGHYDGCGVGDWEQTRVGWREVWESRAPGFF